MTPVRKTTPDTSFANSLGGTVAGWRRRYWLAGMGALATAGLLSACGSGKPPFVGIDITGADYANTFQLQDHNGQLRTMADFKGKVVVIFFGFTQCPDVCPTTMSDIAQARQLLGADGERLQGLFVSIDPERDTPEIMREYMANFDPSFLALYAPENQLPEVAKHFKIYYKKVAGSSATSYTMDHSAGSYVYDPQGRVRLYHRYGTGAEGLASDVKRLLAEG